MDEPLSALGTFAAASRARLTVEDHSKRDDIPPEGPMAAPVPHQIGQPGNPAGIPNPRVTRHGIWGMRKANYAPVQGGLAAQLLADGYYPPGVPPPLAAPGAVANPAQELFGGGAWNSTGTQPPTGVPFGAHPVKLPPPLAAPGWQHVATLVLRFRHYPTPAAIAAGIPAVPPVAAVAGRPTRLVWQVRLADPYLQPALPHRWAGCVNWAPQHDAAHAAPAGLGGVGQLPHPWQHRCVVQQQPDPKVPTVWIDVGHINMGENAQNCYASNGWCPIDAAAGFPPGTADFRAPGLVLGLLVHLVGAPAAGLQPTLAFLRHAVEYDPGYFTDENVHNSHVFMRLFAPPGLPYPIPHAAPQPGASPFHDLLLLMLRLQNPIPPPPGVAPAPPAGHNPFWRYIYYMH